MKQYNVTEKTFADLKFNAFGVPKLNGPDWILIDSQDEINAISASITGGGEAWLEDGKIKTSGRAPSPDMRYNRKTGKWQKSAEKLADLLENQKVNLTNLIAAKLDQLQNAALVGYSQTEKDSFYRQEKEALAWQANKQADCPMLRQIAENRGVPFEILAQKVLEKSALFAAAQGALIGIKQAFEDRTNAATTLEELAQIEQEVAQWQLSLD